MTRALGCLTLLVSAALAGGIHHWDVERVVLWMNVPGREKNVFLRSVACDLSTSGLSYSAWRVNRYGQHAARDGQGDR
jgi:hypothetical protein